MTPLAQLARKVFAEGMAGVHPRNLMARVSFTPAGVRVGDHILEPTGKLFLVAVGKAGATMAEAFLARARRVPEETRVCVPSGAPVPAQVAPYTFLGTHPRVSPQNVAFAEELAAAVATLGPEDGLLVLLSGGGSALLSLPLEGLAPEVFDALVWELGKASASIAEVNTVRKHLGKLFGGRLAATCRAPVLALVLSDVPGNDLATIASGPTVPDPTTSEQALATLERYALAKRFPKAAAILETPESETPKPGDPRFTGKATVLLGSNRNALDAMAAALAAEGFRPQVLTSRLRGEAREVGRVLGALVAHAAPGTALLAGGETTVRVCGPGRGGRNLELALAAALELAGTSHRCLLAAGTDGVDGTSPAAGAVVDGHTLARAKKKGRDAHKALAANNSWAFFEGLPEAIVTGATGTNVADVVLGLVAPRAERSVPLRTPARARQPQPPLGLKACREPDS